jgi:hypothetical protein
LEFNSLTPAWVYKVLGHFLIKKIESLNNEIKEGIETHRKDGSVNF